MTGEEGDLVACPDCGSWVVVLGDGIVTDENSDTEHECNPFPDVYEEGGDA